MRKAKRGRKTKRPLLWVSLTLYPAFLALFLALPYGDPLLFGLGYAFNFAVLYAARRLLDLNELFEDETYFTLNLVVFFLVSLALFGSQLNWFHLEGAEEAYYLLLVGSIVGVLSRTFLRKRPNTAILALATYAVFLASKNIFVAFGFALANLISSDIYGRYRTTLHEIAAVAIGNAVFSVILAAYWLTREPHLVWKLLYLYPTSVLTEIFILFGLQKLLDLLPYMYSDEKLENFANLSNPLLEEMLIRAPGTYHHSVMVSLLAESLAKKLGADPLLVKVGAMFHDIGKLVNPHYFIENINGKNPHAELKPEVSAAIIKNHVEEGLALAEKHNLPKEIIPFIPEHQGTKLIRYFYFKALEENPDVDEEKFRYGGPIPQSKETAIVMITDTVEAMVRTLKEPTADEVRKAVRSALENLKKEGQLKASGLTEEDLKLVEKLLTELILSYYHERIKYPEGPSRRAKTVKSKS
ncbi:MAG: HDIG domain-containing protein [Aquificae bacterium]|nr:HDIG domain-containing protein [Aquificota bacterium]